MKNYGDLGGCYPRTLSSISIILHKIFSLIHYLFSLSLSLSLSLNKALPQLAEVTSFDALSCLKTS